MAHLSLPVLFLSVCVVALAGIAGRVVVFTHNLKADDFLDPPRLLSILKEPPELSSTFQTSSWWLNNNISAEYWSQGYSDTALQHLQRVLQFRTVSQEKDADEFQGLRDYITTTYPLIHRYLNLQMFGDHAMFYTWEGTDPDLKPLLLMAHYDVVPANSPSAWTYPPFAGNVSDYGQYIYGRGTQDIKSVMVGILEAVEHLLRSGHKPRRTIMLAFGGDEESGGKGAQSIAAHLHGSGRQLRMVVDEGGFYTEDMIPTVEKPVAIVGVAEKGSIVLRVRVQGTGGHSSMPPTDGSTPVERLMRIITAVQSHRLPGTAHLADATSVTGNMLRTVGKQASLVTRIITSLLPVSAPLLEWALSTLPTTNALIRTTTATTIIHAGDRANVIPDAAEANINFRLYPGDSPQYVTEYVRRIAEQEDNKYRKKDDKLVSVDNVSSEDQSASGVSCMDPVRCPSYALLSDMITQHGTLHAGNDGSRPVVTPWLVVGRTDSRHYRPVADAVYNFTPYLLKSNDVSRIHGVDERVSVRDFVESIGFWGDMILGADSLDD
eukprot:gb/GECH01014887.1/.p1 GENE.gb/GECH01014887.1/~~gb/GECH01014887.1/.p1  ORF type:complete len:549 (+),score=110.63 gb/GECH01014887.1/:1-1647(+)